jgi:transcriptional regulator with XRE-family HTH domain
MITNLIKLFRVEKRLSQHELAMASGVPRYVIQLAESTNRLPTKEQRSSLASALGTTEDELFPILGW